MRRVIAAAVVTVAMVLAPTGYASAKPPEPPPGAGWRVPDGQTLTWTSPQLLAGDAAVEFYAGDRLLGRPETTDHRTFRMTVDRLPKPGDLQVRAGGRRLDAPPQLRAQRQVTAAVQPPALAEAADVDPGQPGPYATVTGDYSLPGVTLPGYAEKAEMDAVVVAPQGTTGARPLALFLHGRHFTCYAGDDVEQITLDWPCPEGRSAVPSHRGYLQAQRLLASQGYVTVSISANGINAQDNDEDAGAQARSSLVRTHLAHWADWAGDGRASAPAAVRAAPPADMSRVFLMGHSRGGEGVSRAAMDSLSPPPADQDGYDGPVRWTIRGLLLIGPTIFGQNVVPEVPSATILPSCDGDVADLQGQVFVDGTVGLSRGQALHSGLLVVGANHNYFNTEWTPGQAAAPAFDDFPESLEDAVCSPGTPTRLTAAQQQRAGATYIAAAARLFVGGDDEVRPLLDGSGVRAPSADPARVLSHAVGGARTALINPDAGVSVTGAGKLCAEVTRDDDRRCLPLSPLQIPQSPHWAGMSSVPEEPGRASVAMSWSQPGQAVSLTPPAPVDVTGSVALRIAVPPNTTGNRFGVVATDDQGRRADLGDVELNGLPSTDLFPRYWGQEVRVPVEGTVRIAELELVPRGDAGQAWLIDAWGWQAGLPAPQPAGLPRIDVGTIADPVPEGDSGVRTYQMPVRVTGSGAGQVRVFVTDYVSGAGTSWVVPVPSGNRTFQVPVRVPGDAVYAGDRPFGVTVKAISGMVVGDYLGGLLVTEDDPMPTVTFTPVTDRVAEGGTLTWRVTLSEAAGTDLWVYGAPVAPDGPEVSSTDVDPQWFLERTGADPEPSRPLSGTGMGIFGQLPAGQVTAEISIPTVADDADEPDEQVRLEMYGPGDQEPAAMLTGTVTD